MRVISPMKRSQHLVSSRSASPLPTRPADVVALGTGGLRSWVKINVIGTSPPPLRLHGSALDDDVAFLFGGEDDTGPVSVSLGGGGGVIRFDCIQHRLPRSAITISGALAGDMYMFRMHNKGWSRPRTKGTVPEARLGPAMSVAGGSVYIFGGRTGTWQCLVCFPEREKGGG